MIEIRPLKILDACVTVPGSKSHTHRALIVSALAEGESTLINALESEDTRYTARALEALGVSLRWEKGKVLVSGKGGRLDPAQRPIPIGHSGTSMRFLTALASLARGKTQLVGRERMKSRPMKELQKGLEVLGVKVYSQEKEDHLVLIVESDGLRGGKVSLRGEESSQFLSALLMVAPYARKDVTLEIVDRLISKPYVDITIDVMEAYGIEIEREGYRRFHVPRGKRYKGRTYWIEADASSASYFFSDAAIRRGRIRVEPFNPFCHQADARFLEILERMGCEVMRGERWVTVQGGRLRGIEMDLNEMPDLVPTLSVTAAFAEGKTLLKGISHLRHKESDRIAVVARELHRMGIRVEEGEDWLRIEGGEGHGAEIDTENDHRIAMSFAMAGLRIPAIGIRNHPCVNKSFPSFWETLGELYR